MRIKQMHLIIICYNDRIQHIINLEKIIMACGTPYICLRNKCEFDNPEKSYNIEKKKISGDLYYCSCKNNTGIEEIKEQIFARTI